MKILVDARPLFISRPGGVTRVTQSIIRAMCEMMQEDNFTLASTGAGKSIIPFPLPQNATHIHKRIPNKFVSAGTASDLFSFDRWFSSSSPTHLFLPNLGHVGRPRIPYTLLVHDIAFLVEPAWFSLRGRIWHRIVHAKRLIREASHLFAVSNWTKRDLIERMAISSERITMLPIGVSTQTQSLIDLPPTIQNKKFILALGGNDDRKNSDCAIAAFKSLVEDPRFTDCYLVIVGKPKRPIDHPRILILDRPDDSALSTLFRNATIFLYPSWYEGFGLPLHEAAIFNTPCIASTASALPETAPEGTKFAPLSKPHLWTMLYKEILIDTPTHSDFLKKARKFDQQKTGAIIARIIHELC